MFRSGSSLLQGTSRERGARGSDRRPLWNHNIHFHRVVLEAIPAGAISAVDVGTGDGMLSAELRGVVTDVVAIDLDAQVLRRAEAEHSGIVWVNDDVMTHDFGRRFDVVASVATLHHLPDLRSELDRLADLTAPGGVLVIVGLARASTPWDLVVALVGVVQHQWLSRKRRAWEHSAPTAVPEHSLASVKSVRGRTSVLANFVFMF